MVNILGAEDSNGPYAVKGLARMLGVPGAKLYIYGKKTAKPRRKLGHITATGSTVKEALDRAAKARKAIELVPTGGKM
jgi:5-(carboxyamino)imidazole ribonucleotide synthase